MTFVGEADGDAVVSERPELFDEPVLELFSLLAPEKPHDVLSSIHELRAIAPARIEGVGERDSFRISGIPTVFGQAYFLDGSLTRKWREWRASCHDFSLLMNRSWDISGSCVSVWTATKILG